MNRLLKNEKGVTLVELLAVMVIGGIVMVLIMSIFSNGQKQYSSQTAKAEQLNDVRYAAKVITKEIRKAENFTWDETSLTIGTELPMILTKNSNVILKNNKPFITNIKITDLSLADKILTLSMTSLHEDDNKKKTIETKIYLRGDVNGE